MNIITFLHRGAEGIYHSLANFRDGCNCIVYAWEADKFTPEDLPGEQLIVEPGAGEYSGVRLLAKMHAAVRLAANLGGLTAITEYDAAILRPLYPSSHELMGSRLFNAWSISHDPYLAENFLHAPWVTTQAGWRKILAAMDKMKTDDGYTDTEAGYPDRWVSLAALRAGLKLTPTGWSENTLEVSDHRTILSRLAELRTLHGIKRPETIDLICNTTFPI